MAYTYSKTIYSRQLFPITFLRFKSAFLIIALYTKIIHVSSHGRLYEPPGRSTLWRLPEFQVYDPAPVENYDDDQLYCGAIGKLIANGGKCGPCGDDWEIPKPRPNENGGIYGIGIISRNYSVQQKIQIGIDVTTNHGGYFEFRLCPLKANKNNIAEADDCFDKYLLELGDGSGNTRLEIASDGPPGWYNTTVKLPSGISGRAVLQWHWRVGNSWNPCNDTDKENGVQENEIQGSTRCGPQEIFRGCSDIFIGDKSKFPPGPRPGVVTSTATPAIDSTTTVGTTPTPIPASVTSPTQVPPASGTGNSNKKPKPRPAIPTMRPPKSKKK